jgi:AraC-like DNA-binding protein
VVQIVYGSGFRDPAYFSRFFKRYTAMTPGAWWRMKRASHLANDTSFAAGP